MTANRSRVGLNGWILEFPQPKCAQYCAHDQHCRNSNSIGLTSCALKRFWFSHWGAEGLQPLSSVPSLFKTPIGEQMGWRFFEPGIERPLIRFRPVFSHSLGKHPVGRLSVYRFRSTGILDVTLHIIHQRGLL